MIFGYFILTVALIISAVSAFYSITGLTAIFAAAFWPIIIMGSALEVGKIATTVWLHKYWQQAAMRYKLYLVPAVGILMLITSMGIFGFLSKAHLDQAVPSGDVAAKVSLYDEKIQIQRENIKAARANLSQLDAAVNETMGRSTSEQGADKAVAIRRAQAKDRAKLMQEIDTAQKVITKLQEERAPIAAEQRKVEAEVGPIKYIAALIYDQTAAENADLLERAVRWVIILIVSVFDPLALVLILAATQTIEWERSDKTATHLDEVNHPKEEEDTNIPLDSLPPVDDEAERAAEANALMSEIEREPETEVIEETAPAAEPEDVFVEVGKPKLDIAALPKLIETNRQDEDTSHLTFDELLKLNSENRRTTPLRAFGTKFPSPAVTGDLFLNVDTLPSKLYKWNGSNWVEQPKNVADNEFVDNLEYIKFLIEKLQNGECGLDDVSPAEQAKIISYLNDSETTLDSLNETQSGFGTSFPSSPKKGDTFLRVDYLPNKLFKFNGFKWIEIDRTKSDHYAYDDEYVKYLVGKIQSGEIDMSDLTETEEAQVQDFLRSNELQ